MKRKSPQIHRNNGATGGYYCHLCKADADHQPTCKAIKPNSPAEELEGYPTFRCSRKKGHSGMHAACALDDAQDSHPITTWHKQGGNSAYKAKGKRADNEADEYAMNEQKSEEVML